MGLHNLDKNEYQRIIKTGLILTFAGSLFYGCWISIYHGNTEKKKEKKGKKAQREKRHNNIMDRCDIKKVYFYPEI